MLFEYRVFQIRPELRPTLSGHRACPRLLLPSGGVSAFSFSDYQEIIAIVLSPRARDMLPDSVRWLLARFPEVTKVRVAAYPSPLALNNPAHIVYRTMIATFPRRNPQPARTATSRASAPHRSR